MAHLGNQPIPPTTPNSNNMSSHRNGGDRWSNKQNRSSNADQGRGKKRKHNESSRDSPATNMGNGLSALQPPALPQFNLTSGTQQGNLPKPAKEEEDEDQKANPEDWQTVDNGRAKKKAKKIPQPNSGNYPAIEFSEKSRLAAQIKISDLQNLVLYILTDGSAPQFVSVRHRVEIRKVVVLMVPGLEKYDFNYEIKEEKPQRDKHGQYSPDEYYPIKLRKEALPAELEGFADMFPHLWPVRTPGDDRFAKMHSPLHAMLTAPAERSKDDKKWPKEKGKAQPAKEPKGWKNVRTPITEYIHTPEDLLDNEYTLHPASYTMEEEKLALAEHRKSNGVSAADGWVDTKVNNFEDGTPPDNEIQSGSLTAGREILAMDCEMCMTGENEFSLTRISIVGWDGSLIMDELVKPDKPIVDYVTQYSGITEEMIAPVTTTLKDIQEKLVKLIGPRSVLIGHSLNSDLTALKLTHPFIIDTALVYPHPRGPPLKSSLKYLAQKYLNRQVQKGHGSTGPGGGHDSIEDARTCLDLVKQKCEKGKEWGMGDSQGENIFKRIQRAGVKYKNQGGSAVPSPVNAKTSAAIDWGDPKKGPGGGASFMIGCHSDEEIKNGVIRAIKGDPAGEEIPAGGVDFVWARFRELESLKGWWNNNKALNAEAAVAPALPVADAVKTEESADPVAKAEEVLVKAEPDAEGEKATESTEMPKVKEETDVSISLKIEEETGMTVVPKVEEKVDAKAATASTAVSTALANLTQHISDIYASLPPCTAFIVYSGSGDPREMSRYQSMQQQFKREYKVRKWDDLTVKWTDDEEQALKRAVSVARSGIGFITIA